MRIARTASRSIVRSSLAALAVLAAPVAAAESPALPNDVHAPMQMEAGTWDANITYYKDDQSPGTSKGVQVNTLIANGHWVTNDFRIPANGTFPPYQGHGAGGYDPVAKSCVDTRVDTNDLAVRTHYGDWQASECAMVWASKQNDGKGDFIDYRLVEEFRGDTRVFTVYQLGTAKPAPRPVLKIVFTRRPEAKS